MLGLVTAALLAAGWRLSVTPRPARAALAPSTISQAGLPGALRQHLQQLLQDRVDGLPGRPPAIQFGLRLPHAGACSVAGDGCSLIPCIEFVVLTAPISSVGPAQRPCHGRLGAPKILRVSAP